MKIVSMSKCGKKAGFKLGDEIVSLGGFPFSDVLDYYFYDAESDFFAEVKRGGEVIKLHIEKSDYDTLGLEFDGEICPVECKNNCIFCFVSQLPKDMRDTLYVKDDDFRLSFISGSYITLTNLSEADIERIIRLRLSPIYISVHAYDDDIRLKMVRNPKTKQMFDIMRKFKDAGITMHTQIVVCEGINDGAVLTETVEKLHEFYPYVESVAVVPVGLTGHREKLFPLVPISVDGAKATISEVERLNQKFGGFCWCADEYYLKAGIELKPHEYYADFPQIENGVGLVADYLDAFSYGLDEVESKPINKKILLATGTSFYPVLVESAKKLAEKFAPLEVEVVRVENDFFGHSVTVAGLLTGQDLCKNLKGKTADLLILPKNMLKEFDTVFLDRMSVVELSEALKIPIEICASDGSDIAQIISLVGQNNI